MILPSEFYSHDDDDDVQKLQSLAINGRLLAARINADYIDVGIPNGLLYAWGNYDSKDFRI